MADHNSSIHFVTDEQRGGNPADNEANHVQFEECNVKTCKYFNEEGYCAFETCRINVENPATASMITKTCLFCGDKFTVNYNEMVIQMCPRCQKAALKAEGHPHKCMFCGRNMPSNRSLFFRICEKCIACFMVVIRGSASSERKAFNRAHCGFVPPMPEGFGMMDDLSNQIEDAKSSISDTTSSMKPDLGGGGLGGGS